MNNVIIYTRVSSKEQLDGTSLEVQERICRDYAIRENFEVVEVFTERGESAKTTDRPTLRLLLEYIEKNHKNLHAIIVYKVDRLARNTLDHATLKLGFNRLGLRLLSASENLEDTPVGRWVENMLAGTAQFDNEVRTERSTNGMRNAVERGRYVWGAPRGYLNSGGRGKSNLIQDDPDVVRLIRKSWELIDTGCTIEEARKAITKEGLCGKSGKPICKSQFHKMIRNKVYMGIIEKFGLSILGNFKPIVEPDLFRRVQDKLDHKRKNIPIYRKDHPDFPLRGFVTCHKCYKQMTASWSTGHGGKHAYYRCTHCEGVNYKKDLIESKFLQFLKDYSYKSSLKNALIESIKANLEFRNDENLKHKDEIERKLIMLNANDKQIAEKNFKNVINDNLAKEMLDDNQAERSNLSIELDKYTIDPKEIMGIVEQSLSVLEDISGVWIQADLDIKKRFQKFLFNDGVSFDGEKFGTTKIALCLGQNQLLLDQKSTDVSPEGFEPSTFSLRGNCSTIELWAR